MPSGRILFRRPRSKSAKSTIPDESLRFAVQSVFIACGGLLCNGPPLRGSFGDGEHSANLHSFQHRPFDPRFIKQPGNVNQARKLEVPADSPEFANFSGELLLILNPLKVYRWLQCCNPRTSQIRGGVSAHEFAQGVEFQHPRASVRIGCQLYSRGEDGVPRDDYLLDVDFLPLLEFGAWLFRLHAFAGCVARGALRSLVRETRLTPENFRLSPVRLPRRRRSQGSAVHARRVQSLGG